MKHYVIYIIPFGRSAKNAGIITGEPAKRSSWKTGSLTYEVWDDGRHKYELDAMNDSQAYDKVSKLFAEQFKITKPLSGKSYMRHCRVK